MAEWDACSVTQKVSTLLKSAVESRGTTEKFDRVGLSKDTADSCCILTMNSVFVYVHPKLVPVCTSFVLKAYVNLI